MSKPKARSLKLLDEGARPGPSHGSPTLPATPLARFAGGGPERAGADKNVCLTAWVGLMWLFASSAVHAGFFSVNEVVVHGAPPRKLYGVFEGPAREPTEFVPCVEASVKARAPIRGKDIVAKAYFFDAAGRTMGVPAKPAAAQRGGIDRYALPAIFPKNDEERLFFRLPGGGGAGVAHVVVVFGDAKEADARVWPRGSYQGFDFAERALVEGKGGGPGGERKPAMDPVVEHVVEPESGLQSKITLFLRPPEGVSQGGDVAGVLGLCALADNVEGVRRQLQGIEAGKEVQGLIGFAQRKKLAILAWGARTVWDRGASYDELSREDRKRWDKEFDEVAQSWERGVKFLCRKYGLPERDFLLWGSCGGGQWAHRLAMRKPEYFLAVHMHIPSSYDAPTPGGQRLLWLLTTGELDGGYERSLRFYAACREAGYPIIFKPLIGVGHQGSPIADELGRRFFDYALAVRDRRLGEAPKGPLDNLRQSDDVSVADFREAPFFGDFLNQACYPAAERHRIPEGLEVPLPTKILADAWAKFEPPASEAGTGARPR